MTTCACTARNDRGNERRGKGRRKEKGAKTRKQDSSDSEKRQLQRRDSLTIVGLSFFLYVFSHVLRLF